MVSSFLPFHPMRAAHLSDRSRLVPSEKVKVGGSVELRMHLVVAGVQHLDGEFLSTQSSRLTLCILRLELPETPLRGRGGQRARTKC